MASGRLRSLATYVVLTVCAAVPALGLGALWRWAEAERIPAPKDLAVVDQLVASPLITPVLSVRRAPQELARSASGNLLAAALAPVAALAGDTSCLLVAANQAVVLDHGPSTLVTPASNMKLITASVALQVLGANFTFATEVRGDISDGVVTGDLYLVGGGDPLLSTADYPATQQYPAFNVTAVEDLVDQLVTAGVTSVTGNVVGDDSRYDAERFSPNWATGIAGVEAGPLGALLVNDATRTVAPGSVARYTDPAAGAARDFVRLLAARGITVGGSGESGQASSSAALLASVTSAPLSAIVAEMLTTSDDNTAELLIKELGVHAGNGGSRTAGLAVVAATLAARGIDTTAFVFADGSGLDSESVVTCSLILKVLQYESLTSPVGLGLPIAGQTGTLAAEFEGTPMVGRMHAKTGSLRNSKALSGYVTTDAGEIEFSLILDFAGAGTRANFAPIWQALAVALAGYPGGPTADQLGPR